MMKWKRITSAILATLLLTQMTACGFADTAKDTAEKAKDTAEKAADKAKEKAGQAKDQVVEWYEQIDFDKFKQGWDKAVDFASSRYAASVGSQAVANIMNQEHVKKVSNAINDFKTSMNASKGSARGVAQEAGFVAEKWAAGTFNIDAAFRESDYQANVVGSNGLGSVDISTNYGEYVSSKYYKTASGSAKAQADNILNDYKKYANKSKTPMSLPEYVDKHGYNINEIDALLESVYKGQTRIIPSDQLDDAQKYLQGKINNPDTSKLSAQDAKRYKETLDKLKDRLEAPDGTASRPATYEEMQAYTELAQKGKFEPEKYGFSTSQFITPQNIVKTSIVSGVSSGTLNMVLTIGPDIFSILKEAAKNGNFDEAQLKKVGVDGLLAGSEGFVEGSVSCAILTACQAGKFGANLTNASPEVIGTLTVLAIDAIRYGYALSKGEITALDYSNLMTEEIVVAIVSQASGAALQLLLPAVPFAYMAGCMAGGMLATAGLQAVKDMVMEVKDGGGFEAIVPANTVQTMNVITDKISDLHLTEQLSGFKDTVVSTANNGYIQIKAAVEQ